MRNASSPSWKRPEDWNPEAKLKVVLEADALPEDQLGAFVRKQGIHETHLQQWRLQMLNGLGKTMSEKKKTNKRNTADAKRIRSLEKELNRKEKALAEAAAQGIYIGSESSFYRVLKEQQMIHHRENSKPATHKRPEAYVATGPCQVWTWNITYLRTSVLGLVNCICYKTDRFFKNDKTIR